MSVRKHIVVLALAAMALPAAFAAGPAIFVGGEAGWIDQPVQSTVARSQVVQELQAFRAKPVAGDGGLVVGGEAGYLFPQHTYARVGGQWVCTDGIAHNARPDAIRSAAERRAFLKQYPA